VWRVNRVFINIPNQKNRSRGSGQELGACQWPVTTALRNVPMALDEAHRRLIIGYRTPPQMLILDTETGKPTGGGNRA
jgi:hypothetical protein